MKFLLPILLLIFVSCGKKDDGAVLASPNNAQLNPLVNGQQLNDNYSSGTGYYGHDYSSDQEVVSNAGYAKSWGVPRQMDYNYFRQGNNWGIRPCHRSYNNRNFYFSDMYKMQYFLYQMQGRFQLNQYNQYNQYNNNHNNHGGYGGGY